MLRTSDRFLALGHHVLRLNLRGAGPSRAVCAGQYSACSSDDIRAFLAQLPSALTGDGIAAVGYSMGGAILLKYLGEQGSHSPIRAAASISAPVDLSGTCRDLMRFRNGLYHFYVLSRIKREATAKGAVLTALEAANIEISQTIWQYDDLFTAPRNGFRGAADYYSRCSALNFLAAIRVPTLVLTSLDDPWVPGGAYCDHDWESNTSLSLMPLLLPRGGHVGFHGGGEGGLWSDMAVVKFFAG
jgi:predicted alpha/beta-fold hydrolase